MRRQRSGNDFPGRLSAQCGDGVGAAPHPRATSWPWTRISGSLCHELQPWRSRTTFGSNLSLEVDYVGNHGYRLLSFADINQAPLGAAYCLNTLTAAQLADACAGVPLRIRQLAMRRMATQEARPFYHQVPLLGFINQIANRSYSNYNSLQVNLTKRMSHGLSFNAGYTYGHGLDNGSLNRFGQTPQNNNNLAAEYGSSDFDVRHRFTVTATYNIPGIKGFGQLLEGWQINTIVNAPDRPAMGSVGCRGQFQRDRGKQ